MKKYWLDIKWGILEEDCADRTFILNARYAQLSELCSADLAFCSSLISASQRLAARSHRRRRAAPFAGCYLVLIVLRLSH